MQTEACLITSYFENDHDRLDDLFKQFQAAKQADFPKALDCFCGFKAGLLRHIAWEEEVLFRQFEAKTGMRGAGPTEVMRIEHGEIKRLLETLHEKTRQQGADSELDEAALLSILDAHNQKEERILYPMIDKLLNEPERRGVFAEMERISRRHPSADCAVAGNADGR